MISAGEVALNRLVLLSRGLSSLAFLQFEAIRKSGDPLPNGIGMRCVFDPTLKALQLDFFNNSRGIRPFCRKVNLLDGSFDDCVDLFRKPALSTIRSAFPQKGRNTLGNSAISFPLALADVGISRSAVSRGIRLTVAPGGCARWSML